MPVEQRGRVIAVEFGPTGSNREEPEGSAEGGSLRTVNRTPRTAAEECLHSHLRRRQARTHERHVQVARRVGIGTGLTERLDDPPAAAVVGRRWRKRPGAAPIRLMKDDRTS